MNQAPDNFEDFLRDFERSVLEISRITNLLMASEGGGEITSDDDNGENIANNIINNNPNSQAVDSENNGQQ